MFYTINNKFPGVFRILTLYMQSFTNFQYTFLIKDMENFLFLSLYTVSWVQSRLYIKYHIEVTYYLYVDNSTEYPLKFLLNKILAEMFMKYKDIITSSIYFSFLQSSYCLSVCVCTELPRVFSQAPWSGCHQCRRHIYRTFSPAIITFHENLGLHKFS